MIFKFVLLPAIVLISVGGRWMYVSLYGIVLCILNILITRCENMKSFDRNIENLPIFLIDNYYIIIHYIILSG